MNKPSDKLRKAEVKMAEKLLKAKIEAAEKMARLQARAEATMAQAKAWAAQPSGQDQPVHRRIRIDLLSEAREREERWRNHPVKRGAWVAGFCVCVMVLWLLELQLAIDLSQTKARNLQRRYEVVRARTARAHDYVIKGGYIDTKLTAFDRLTTNRFLWAPMLNALQEIMIDDIQLTRLSSRQKLTREGPRTLGTGRRKRVVPGDIVERDTVQLEARDTSSNQLSYLNYKDSLCRCEYFVSQLKSRDGFVLEGTLKPPGPAKSNPANKFTVFVLGSHFPEVRRSY